MKGISNLEKDRAIGALVGLAVGDAVGTTLEFKARDSYKHVTDMVGGGPFGLNPGEWTDDTSMALALADSLLEFPELNASDLMQRFVSWRDNGEYSCTGKCFDIGITTNDSLNEFLRTKNPFAGSEDPWSAGNGSLMRVAPVAIRHWRNKVTLDSIAEQQSRTTHAVAESVDACRFFVQVLASIIDGAHVDLAISNTSGVFEPAVESVRAGAWRVKSRNEIRSSGYVMHTLEAAIWCVAGTNDFRSAVLLAANLGDDADTTAAVAGQLAGAVYGVNGIPKEWLAKLAWRERIEDVANNLFIESLKECNGS